MSVTVLEQANIFEIRTDKSSYVFGINEKGIIQHLYWGAHVEAADCGYLLKSRLHSSFDAEIDRETEEYGGWGGCNYAEPALKVSFADGVRDLKLRYEGYRVVGENEIVLRMVDRYYPLDIEVHYKAIPEYDLIERFVHVRNSQTESVRIEQVMAAVWTVQALPDYRMTHVTGRWAGEYQLRSTVLSEGKKVLESRRGFTGPHANPWFAIDNGKADETSGSVWFGALGWSGNWKIVAEKSTFGHVRIVGGVNDFDSAFVLAPGEVYASPVFVGGFTSGGFGQMSRNLHKYQRDYVLPTNELRKVLYNSWEATEFAVTVEGQKELAQQAARLGVERFVVDDGWFGERHSDRAGLGDWYVNAEKFPNGLEELIDHVKGLGMEFGLWVEPESVNPDSDLYRAHPEWVYQFPTREGTQLRNQLLLNVGLPEVKQFILGFMTTLLTKYDIRFIKWDMNRTVTEPGTVASGQDVGASMWIKHVDHLYAIWAELRERFPHVEFETCAGGGARIDLGILRYADQAWISDNTDARDRLAIQEGFSYAYSPSVMMCWVTESPHGFNGRSLPLSYRFHSAMMGGLGIGANISKWSTEELEKAKSYVELYKEIRPVILNGDMYRLSSLRDSNVAAYQYNSKDRSENVVFTFLQSQHFGSEVRHLLLQGLVSHASYEVNIDEGEPFVRQGSTLMNLGVAVSLRGDYKSIMIRIIRLD
ncbi:Alpha-galactosidase AgaA [Paenibacillus allorhizoplanae]|uniref:Alpha-galactosidase n=1 Tax=Paenibacillus allorhizoplanae TaxID=2905648 RepID=A0ABM9CF00_9BACL|nr:alpha-galactosidase [Paenibacillus allorhizoplanae]CAH1211924.1 Alpha-galactosidase AgaA [Paenibacillus allorhizoplanae]